MYRLARQQNVDQRPWSSARSRTVRVPGTRYGDLIVKTGGRKGLQGGISTNKTTIRSFLSSNDPNNTDFVFEFFQSISKSNGNNPKLKMLFEELKADVATLLLDKNNNNILSFLPK